MVPHDAIYRHAALYDLAFSYRDFAAESAFLRGIYEQRRGHAPRSFLELAAGPAGHALEMLSGGLDVMALDLAPGWPPTRGCSRAANTRHSLSEMAQSWPPWWTAHHCRRHVLREIRLGQRLRCHNPCR